MKQDWDVYRYTLREEELIDKLLNLCEKYPDSACLGYYTDYDETSEVFNLTGLNISLFVLADKSEIVEKDNHLGNWFDADGYTLDEESIKGLKRNTEKTKQLLLKIKEMNNEFKKLVYENKVHKD